MHTANGMHVCQVVPKLVRNMITGGVHLLDHENPQNVAKMYFILPTGSGAVVPPGLTQKSEKYLWSLQF